MFDAVNQIDIPSFILTVDGDKTIRFGALNAAHEAVTGMSTKSIAGHRPHDILPPRMADTVLANYTTCLETGEPYAYGEVLDLPAGQFWWQTSLNPIFVDGRVEGIVGIATDITDHRVRQDSLVANTFALRDRSETMETLAHASMSQMRGPLNNIVSLARLLQSGAHDPEVLDLMIGTAVSALKEIDAFERRSVDEPSERTAMIEVDFGHFCRDRAAILDPGRARGITFPDLRVVVEKPRFEAAMSAILDHAAAYCETYLSISVSADPSQRSALSVRVRCDVTDTRAQDQNWLISAVAARGGTLQIENHAFGTGTGMERTYTCSFPGRILAEALGEDRARAVNRRMKDPATG